jgi:hypothetical protein
MASSRSCLGFWGEDVSVKEAEENAERDTVRVGSFWQLLLGLYDTRIPWTWAFAMLGAGAISERCHWARQGGLLIWKKQSNFIVPKPNAVLRMPCRHTQQARKNPNRKGLASPSACP